MTLTSPTNQLSGLLQRLRCFLGRHDASPDLDARYDRCAACQARWRAI